MLSLSGAAIVAAGASVHAQEVYAPPMAPVRGADYELWSDTRRAFERARDEQGAAPAQPAREDVEWQFLTPEARAERLIERHLSRLDAGILNRYALPLIGVSNGGRAGFIAAEKKWAAHTADEKARHDILVLADPPRAKAMRDEYHRTAYRRRQSLLWDPTVRKLMDRR